MKQGDFTSLAQNYRYRVGYSELVLKTLLNLIKRDASSLRVADVGAGTGKLTKDLLELGLSIIAVEPNDAMREEGIKYTTEHNAEWVKGSGENTSLPDNSVDWVLMGSSFHWVELEKGLKEFHRILKKGGQFTILWNPRDLERNELQKRIDDRIHSMVPNLKRVSSGGKTHGADWFSKLRVNELFGEVLFMEAKHDVEMSHEQYMGAWNSVNDIRAQCGEEIWKEIIQMIETEIQDHKTIKMPYSTRSWTTWKR